MEPEMTDKNTITFLRKFNYKPGWFPTSYDEAKELLKGEFTDPERYLEFVISEPQEVHTLGGRHGGILYEGSEGSDAADFMWTLYRDGEVRAYFEREADLLEHLHRVQGQSWYYALKHGGWSIKPPVLRSLVGQYPTDSDRLEKHLTEAWQSYYQQRGQ